MDPVYEKIISWYLKPKKLALFLCILLALLFFVVKNIQVIVYSVSKAQAAAGIADSICTVIGCIITIYVFRFVRSVQKQYRSIQSKLDWKQGALFWFLIVVSVLLFVLNDALSSTAVQICTNAIFVICSRINLVLCILLLLNLLLEGDGKLFRQVFTVFAILLPAYVLRDVMNVLFANLSHAGFLVTGPGLTTLAIDATESIMMLSIAVFCCLKYRNRVLLAIVSLTAYFLFFISLVIFLYTMLLHKNTNMRFVSYIYHLVVAGFFQFLIYRRLTAKKKEPPIEEAKPAESTEPALENPQAEISGAISDLDSDSSIQ